MGMRGFLSQPWIDLNLAGREECDDRRCVLAELAGVNPDEWACRVPPRGITREKRALAGQGRDGLCFLPERLGIETLGSPAPGQAESRKCEDGCTPHGDLTTPSQPAASLRFLPGFPGNLCAVRLVFWLYVLTMLAGLGMAFGVAASP
jgi:hypothetical protein